MLLLLYCVALSNYVDLFPQPPFCLSLCSFVFDEFCFYSHGCDLYRAAVHVFLSVRTLSLESARSFILFENVFLNDLERTS